MTDSNNWYYNQDGIALGPFTSEFMETEYEKGTFPSDTLLWHPDQSDWLTLIACQPVWTRGGARAILQPGPLHIPLPLQSATRHQTPPSLSADSTPPPRSPLKPIAYSEAPVTHPPSKEGILRRLFGRKS